MKFMKYLISAVRGEPQALQPAGSVHLVSTPRSGFT
jgi:hypothetical protein